MNENCKEINAPEEDVTYLERVEAVGIAMLTKALLDGEITMAWDVARLLRYLQIV